MNPALSLRERAPLYDFAARLIAAEVDAPLYAALGREPLRTLLARAEPGFATWIETPFDAERSEALAEEYARLFVLPGVVPPFASRWLADAGDRERARNDVARLVSSACEGLGLTPTSSGPGGRLPPDHAALVFGVAAPAGGLPDAEGDPLVAHFATELLGPAWAGFGDAIRGAADSPLYRALGVLLRDLHRSDETIAGRATGASAETSATP